MDCDSYAWIFFELTDKIRTKFGIAGGTQNRSLQSSSDALRNQVLSRTSRSVPAKDAVLKRCVDKHRSIVRLQDATTLTSSWRVPKLSVIAHPDQPSGCPGIVRPGCSALPPCPQSGFLPKLGMPQRAPRRYSRSRP